jgi:monoamine oxidase
MGHSPRNSRSAPADVAARAGGARGFDRRSLLAGSLALAATPALGQVPASGVVDVAVVGAGAAGIAATRRLADAGKRVALLEASDHVGGRCVTDTKLFGVPFDRGAHWIPLSAMSPMAMLAVLGELDIYRAPSSEQLRTGQRYADAAEMEALSEAQKRADRAISESAHGQPDMPCSEALPKDLAGLGPTVEFLLGAYSCGKDLADVSTVDFANSEERERDYFCRQGFGTILERAAQGLPVQLSTPVTEIDYSGRSAALLKTASGTLQAQAVIVTVSLGVLAADVIAFRPHLPLRHLEATRKLTLGSYDHIAVELPGNPLGLGSDDVVYEKAASNRTAALLANVSGTPLCLIDVGGSFGRALAAQGDAAMIDFGVNWLAGLFGNNIKAAVKRRYATRWGSAPWIRGAYSCAAPGTQPARDVLVESINDRIWFAGEATHETLWGTVAGAWDSGERAADSILKRLAE